MVRTLRILALGLFAVSCKSAGSASVSPADLGPIPATIQADVSFIGSAAQEGRLTGSAGSKRAATYILTQYKKLPLKGAFPSRCSGDDDVCDEAFYQQFNRTNARNGRNIAALIPGTDPALRGEYVVAGAHYDHIGRSETLSNDAWMKDAIRPGADDNASGTVAVMELARRLSANPPRRSVLIVHFDAEEEGLIGSDVFVRLPPVRLNAMKFMLNLDMVGRLRTGKFEIDKSGLIFNDPPLVAVLDSAASSLGIKYTVTSEFADRSDHANFRIQGVSAIALFTGNHNDYHRASDTVDKLDVRGIGRIVDISEALLRFAANR